VHIPEYPFRQLVEETDIPVYALGGMTADDIEQAWNSGAQGIAAISVFWDCKKADSLS